MKFKKIDIIKRCAEIWHCRGKRYFDSAGHADMSYEDVCRMLKKSLVCNDRSKIYNIVYRHLLLEKMENIAMEKRCMLTAYDKIKIENI
jgi:hypothetical protein